jgi:hypothetical protein
VEVLTQCYEDAMARAHRDQRLRLDRVSWH